MKNDPRILITLCNAGLCNQIQIEKEPHRKKHYSINGHVFFVTKAIEKLTTASCFDWAFKPIDKS